MSEPLTVSFAALHKGPVRKRWSLAAPESLLGSFPVSLGVVEIELGLRGSPRDGVRVRGTVASTVEARCRRCLTEMAFPVRSDVDAWFRTESQVTPGEDGVWAFSRGDGEIDLGAPIREELLLAIPPYPVCEDECVGLCPSCGVRLAEEECTCPPPEADPRWAALEALRASEGDHAPDAPAGEA